VKVNNLMNQQSIKRITSSHSVAKVKMMKKRATVRTSSTTQRVKLARQV